MRYETMQCAECQASLSDYLDGDLSDAQRTAVDGHMRDCARCATVRNDLARIIHASASLAPATPSPKVWEGIRREIGGASNVVGGPRAWWDRAGERRYEFSVSARQLAAAAAAVVVLGGAFWTYRLNSTGATQPVGAHVGAPVGESPNAAFLSYSAGRDEVRQLQSTVDGMARDLAQREPSWPEDLRDSYRKSIAELDAKIADCQRAYDDTGTEAARGPLVAAYLAKISSLSEFARAEAAARQHTK